MYEEFEEYDEQEALEEELKRQKRAERIAQMKREKQEQLRKRKLIKQLIKKLAIPAIIALAIIIAIPIIIVKAVKARANRVPEESQTTEEYYVEESTEEEVPEEPAKHYAYKDADNMVLLGGENMTSTCAILVSLDNNEVIGQRDYKDRMVPASMTKVLTLLVAAENVENVKDKVEVTYEATNWSYINDCSAVGFSVGEVVTVEDLMYGTILSSGGDAAYQLAMYVAGSHEAFVDMMNDKLEELGLSETTHFTNCAGLYDVDHYSTCYDMAIIMNAAIDNEYCKEILRAHTYNTSLTEEHPEGLLISNWFLRRIEDRDTGGEVIGAKTGFVDQSGCCAVSYGVQNDGKEYIVVTCDARSNWRCIKDHVDIYLNSTGSGSADATSNEADITEETQEEDTLASD